jgi:hypothetical protein
MERIYIDYRDDICTCCAVLFEHKKRYWLQTIPNDASGEILPKGIKLVEFITTCVNCRNLMNKKRDLEKKLNDIDFLIYCQLNI